MFELTSLVWKEKARIAAHKNIKKEFSLPIAPFFAARPTSRSDFPLQIMRIGVPMKIMHLHTEEELSGN